MDSSFFLWLAVGIAVLAAPLLIVAQDWRWMLGLLAALYLAAFILVYRHWPIGMSVVKLVTGWMGIAALGMTRLNIASLDEQRGPFFVEGTPFRLFSVAIIILISFSAAARIEAMIPGIGQPIIIGGLLLMGTGVLHLGMTSEALRITIGLLTILAGFEIVYAGVESSVLVAALLAAANLGLALMGSYLLLQSHPVVEEEGEEPL